MSMEIPFVSWAPSRIASTYSRFSSRGTAGLKTRVRPSHPKEPFKIVPSSLKEKEDSTLTVSGSWENETETIISAGSPWYPVPGLQRETSKGENRRISQEIRGIKQSKPPRKLKNPRKFDDKKTVPGNFLFFIRPKPPYR
jgi:hypothetical protein